MVQTTSNGRTQMRSKSSRPVVQSGRNGDILGKQDYVRTPVQ